MRFDERAPLAITIPSLLSDKPSNLATWGADPREIENTIAEMQRNMIFPGSGDRRGRPQDFYQLHRGMENEHFVIAWGVLIQDYTARALTCQTDKLVAIAGIANTISTLKNIEYVGGIFNLPPGTLTLGLLWDAAKPGPRLKDVAPSWSWASVACEVRWSGHLSVHLRQTARVLKFRCDGSVARCEGEIRVKTNVRPGVVGRDGKVGMARWPVEGARGVLLEAEVARLSVGGTLNWKQGVVTLDEELRPFQLVYFVELARGKVNSERKDWLVHAMVIADTEEMPGKFYRVGFSTWSEEFWRDPTGELTSDGSNKNMNTDSGERDGGSTISGLGLKVVEVTVI